MHLAEYGISDSDLVNIPGMADLRRKIEETAARVDLTMVTQRRNTRSVEEVTMGIDSSMDSSMSKMLNEH